MEEYDKVCTILDKLTIDTLTLMEETLILKHSIENSMSEGEMHLAKSRYIMGHHNVSAVQLPTENSPEVDPLVVVNREDDQLLGGKSFDVEFKSESKNEETSTLINPLKWFGVLVPQNLHQAQAKFRQALILIVNCAGIQTRLQEYCTAISQLTAHKEKLLKAEE